MKTYLLKLNSLFVVILFLTSLTLFGCGGTSLMRDVMEDGLDDGSDASDEETERVIASFSLGDQYFYIPNNEYGVDSSLYPAMATMEEIARGFVKIYNPELHFPIDWNDEENLPLLVVHEEVEAIMAENGVPNDISCALSVSAGTNSLPPMGPSWSGSQLGGCGTWATAMCNRILGITDSDSQVTEDEWNDIASGIGQDANGGSKMSKQAEYYKSLGYCVQDKKFGGSEADYEEMEEKIEDGCDVKLVFATRNADGTYSNGHVETVTGADADSQTATTNSWGNQGTVSGGGDGGFDHSLDGTQFQDASGNELWPSGSTEVWVSYVCECGFFEGLAKALGF